MIYVVLALSQLKINDIDGVNLAHLVVSVALADVLGDSLRHSIEHTMEVSNLVTILNFYDDQFSLFGFCQHIHTIVLVKFVILVAFAFQEFLNLHLLANQGKQQSFQHCVVSLVSKQSFDSPIESDIFFIVN